MNKYVFFLLLLFGQLYAQLDTNAIKIDTAKPKNMEKKRIRTATLLSTVLPGSGQIYNRKAWKTPIVYAGLGGFGYLFYAQNALYKEIRTEIKDRSSTNIIKDDVYKNQSLTDLVSIKNEARRRRDLAAVGVAVVYVINILDANVDAHLRDFDAKVNADLSVGIRPRFNFNTYTNSVNSGLAIVFNFH